MAYTWELQTSIEQTDLDAWYDVCGSDNDPFMDPRFIATVERSLPDAGTYWTLLIYDPQRRPVAAACLCLQQVDGSLLADPKYQPWVEAIRRVWNGYLRFNVLMVGLPVSAGQSHLRIRADADAEQVCRVLNRVLEQLAAEHRAKLIAIKEFSDEQCTQLVGLRQCGYLLADSLPMNEFPAQFSNFDDYSAALRSRYRKNIRASRQKFERSDLWSNRLTGNDEIDRFYTDQTHELYKAVLARAPIQFEELSAEFFRELARQFGDQAVFNVIHRDERIVAFGCSLRTESEFHMLFMGIDYEVNSEVDLYFNLIFNEIDFALRQHVSRIHVGQNADGFKTRLGCRQEPRRFFVKGCGVLKRLLPLGRRWFFPPIETAPTRTVLREEPQKQVADSVV